MIFLPGQKPTRKWHSYVSNTDIDISLIKKKLVLIRQLNQPKTKKI